MGDHIKNRAYRRIHLFQPWFSRSPTSKDRTAITRAFVAKMVYNMPTTRQLLDRLVTDISLRRISGWERRNDIPDEWTFARALSEFSASHLPERVHEVFIKQGYAGELVVHNSRDSTAIEAREKPIKKAPIKEIAAPNEVALYRVKFIIFYCSYTHFSVT